ncbi:MAG: hypothetical protein Q4G27_02850 [Flavobacteriaceae bacterium]|nr:hypothetical protein [Flavobacteriaceae bacterium]
MIKVLSILLQAFVLFSCNQNSNDNNFIKKRMSEIDIFIAKYSDTDFSEFKNSFIAIRQKDRNEVIYLVQRPENNLPVYFVTYDLQKKNITDINRSMLEKNGVEDYYTDEDIVNLVNLFRKYDFALLQVDNDNNVFINPFEINSPAILLRLNSETNEKTIKKGYVYTHYKNNWYVRK